MDFKKSDTLAKLKANTVGFKFKFMNRDSKNEYEYRIDGTGVSSVEGEKEFRTSLENAIEFIEEGRWVLLKTSSEHPHADLIRAYADGAKIQWRASENHKWVECNHPAFYPDQEYRVKPMMQKKLFKVLFFFDGQYDESGLYYLSIDVFNSHHQHHRYTTIGINPLKFIEVDIDSPDFR